MTPEALRAALAEQPGETPEERWAALVESRLPPGEPGFTPFWWRTMREFWRSGKTALLVGKANRAGGTTHIARMCAAPESVFRERTPVADSELVWANASATVPLANGSLRLFASTLRTLGYREVARRSKDELKRIDAGSMFVSDGSNAAPGRVEFLDLAGNRIEFRSQTASKAGMSGFTGIGLTADEAELWKGEAEKPSDVLGLGMSRLKGQSGAKAYLISRFFSEEGVLAKIAARGDTESLMVARLGAEGARDDEIGRAALREHLRAIGSQGDRASWRYAQDARLTEAADPASAIIPAWVGIGPPETTIIECWRLAGTGVDLEEGEIPIDGLFRVYGGRPTGHEGERYFDAEALKAAREMMV